ncbi:hypothetical protein WMY93_003217 [Mugilogobius chulae]|uniref:Uncharacterized protein n=1 Tax=Mugilogobius chulae TaxID=88201 RepID=A0AAW0QB25_9GOBI
MRAERTRERGSGGVMAATEDPGGEGHRLARIGTYGKLKCREDKQLCQSRCCCSKVAQDDPLHYSSLKHLHKPRPCGPADARLVQDDVTYSTVNPHRNKRGLNCVRCPPVSLFKHDSLCD